jgi:hypothetical protein
MPRIVLQHELFKLPHGKTPDAVRVNELGIIRAGRNEFNATAKFPLGFGWL